MNDQQLQEKFIDQCQPVLGSYVQSVSDTCWKLDTVEDVAQLARSL